MKYRSVITYKHYFESFFEKLEIMVQNKIINTIRYIEEIERIPEKYFKHLSGTKGLYEIRALIHSACLYGLIEFKDTPSWLRRIQ